MRFEEEMAKQSIYSSEFKDAIVTKIMNRGKTSVLEVCEREGISLSAAYKWLKRGSLPAMKSKSASKKWSAKEKLKAVSVSLTASDAETGLYLRKEGLHSQQVADWQGQVLTSLEPTSKRGGGKDVRDDRILELERELLRKDKALAEASALLILQKKVNLIWGDEAQK